MCFIPFLIRSQLCAACGLLFLAFFVLYRVRSPFSVRSCTAECSERCNISSVRCFLPIRRTFLPVRCFSHLFGVFRACLVLFSPIWCFSHLFGVFLIPNVFFALCLIFRPFFSLLASFRQWQHCICVSTGGFDVP